MKHSFEVQAVTALKDVETTIRSVRVKREEKGEFHADAEVESIYRDTTFSGTTHFVIEYFGEELKVVSMTKTKH